MTTRRWLGVAAAVALALIVGRFIAGVYVDYRWYDSLGDGPLAVWRARTADLAAIRLVLTLAASAFLFANLYGVSSSVESLVLPRRLGDLEIGERVPGRRLLWAAGGVAVLIGAVLSLAVDDWTSFDLVQFARPFGVADPYTDADLSFFVYWLPFENALYVWSIGVLLTSAALVTLLYVLTAGLRWENGRLHATRHVRRHLTVLGAGLLLVLAWGHRLDAYALLGGGSGPEGAFGFVDDRIVLQSRFALAALTAIGALLVLNAGWQGQPRLTLWVVSGVILVTVMLRGVLPAIALRVVTGDESARRNAPYLHNRAAVSQTAYGVNVVRAAPASYGIAGAADADGTLPLWDPPALARAVEHRRRGEIVTEELGWQALHGRLAAIAVMRPAPPPETEPLSWSVAPIAASVADAGGEPLVIDSIGTLAATAELRDRRLLVLLQADGYAIVSDTTGRLIADGIASFWPRLAHAWDERDLRLLFDRAIDRIENPVIVLHRDVRERIDAIVPFFVRGRSVSPLLVRDTLYWACHLYAASKTFPLSQRYGIGGEEWGYFRHAATAVVNAETGATWIVPDPTPDQVTDAWIRRFPSLFTAPSALPPGLAAALPPVTDGVLAQAWAMSQYGSRADFTPVPTHVAGGDSGDSALGIGARALALLPTIDTPTEDVPGWTLPLLDTADRVTGVLVSLGGARPVTIWVPSAGVGDRWGDVNERLRGAVPPGLADGRELSRGRALTIPVGGQLAYLQSMYAGRDDGRPIVAGIAALFGDTLRTGRSARAALGAPPDRVPTGASPDGTRPSAQPTSLRALYESMRAALRRGDWAQFGAAFDSLGAVIRRAPR